MEIKKLEFEDTMQNPSVTTVGKIIKLIVKNDGYCPCSQPNAAKEDTKCPCKHYRETHDCCCTLYVKKIKQGETAY